MARTEITSDQRAMAVALLANALRKDAHVRARTGDGDGRRHDLSGLGSRARSDASQQYIRGMRDLLAVLFQNGRAVADACYDDARIQAFGPTSCTAPEDDR